MQKLEDENLMTLSLLNLSPFPGQAEQGKTDMENYIAKLEEEKAGLEKEVSDLKITCQMVEKRAQEQKLAEEKKHGEEINFLKRTNQQLKAQLEGIIAQKK